MIFAAITEDRVKNDDEALKYKLELQPTSNLKKLDIDYGMKIEDLFSRDERGKRQADVTGVYETEDNLFDLDDDEKESGSQKLTDKKHYIITDNDGKKINVTFPPIHVTFGTRKNGEAKTFIDTTDDFEGIETFQLILQQGEHKGILTGNDELYTWQEAKKAYEERGLLLPYITAELKSNDFGRSLEFDVGNKLSFGGYYNGELVDDTSKYTLRIRGVVKDKNHERIIIDTDVIGEIDRTKKMSFISAGGASVFLIIIIGFIVSHFIRKRREKRRVIETIAKFNDMLANDDCRISPPAAKAFTSLAVPESKSAMTTNTASTEWWTQDESEYPAECQCAGTCHCGDQYSGQYSGQYGGQYSGQYEEYDEYGEGDQYDTQGDAAFGAQYSAIEAASRLLSENDKNIVKRRT